MISLIIVMGGSLVFLFVHIKYCFEQNWRTQVHVFGLLAASALRFKARVYPLTCMIQCLRTLDSTDSPLVQHLLTCWWPTD